MEEQEIIITLILYVIVKWLSRIFRLRKLSLFSVLIVGNGLKLILTVNLLDVTNAKMRTEKGKK